MKRVLVTGGNRGIGLEIIKKFLDKGHAVIVLARSKPSISSKNLEFHKFDLTEYEKIPGLFNTIGPVDVLINNAGIMNALPYDSYPDEKMLEMLAINLQSPVALIREFSKSMVEKGSGRIINMASIAGYTGHPDIWYGATKAGIYNVTKGFAGVLGPKGITVNAVSPGPVETDMLNTIPEQRRKDIISRTSLKRPAKASEIAEVAYWLAEEAPAYINGIAIDVTSGSYLR